MNSSYRLKAVVFSEHNLCDFYADFLGKKENIFLKNSGKHVFSELIKIDVKGNEFQFETTYISRDSLFYRIKHKFDGHLKIFVKEYNQKAVFGKYLKKTNPFGMHELMKVSCAKEFIFRKEKEKKQDLECYFAIVSKNDFLNDSDKIFEFGAKAFFEGNRDYFMENSK